MNIIDNTNENNNNEPMFMIEPGVTELHLFGTMKERQVSMTSLVRVLKDNKTITMLDLRMNDIDDDAVVTLADSLKINSSITKLFLAFNKFGDKGAIALSEMLLENSTLSNLNMTNNEIYDNGYYAIAKALLTNRTLLSVGIQSKSTIFSKRVVDAFCDVVRNNSTLKHISCPYYDLSFDGTQEAIQCFESFAYNSSIEIVNFRLDKMPDEVIMRVYRKNSSLVGNGFSNKTLSSWFMFLNQKCKELNTTLEQRDSVPMSIGENEIETFLTNGKESN